MTMTVTCEASSTSSSSSANEADQQHDEQRIENEENPWKNRNVRLSIALCVLEGVADSIWMSVVLSGFLYALGNAMGKQDEDNTLVGAAEALEGLVQLIFALPIGVLADWYGKARIVAYGGGLMLLTIVITVWAVTDATFHSSSVHDATRAYRWLLVALALWGVVGGIASGPSQALFADSIRKGKRSELLTWLYSCYLLSSTVGPIVSILLLVHADADSSWSMKEIYPVFMIGLLLEIPSAILMCFFSDKHVVHEEEEETEEVDVPETNDETTAQQETQVTSTSTYKSMGKAAIPYVLFVSSLVVSLGSGASVKYFPLFFKELGYSSAAVQGIFLVVPVSISAFSFMAQRTSTKLGRIETTLLFDVIGTSLLFYMTWLSRDEAHLDSSNKTLIVFVYILRTGIMNSSYPLLESILMDSVPSNQRARWKSLESIAAFGWTGSALAGGILADERSYRFTFCITAAMQLAGAFLLIFIQPFVESEVKEQENAVAVEEQDTNGLAEPLLAAHEREEGQ